MSNAELLDLLREARDIIDYRNCDCGNEACERLGVFVRCIDTALADQTKGLSQSAVDWFPNGPRGFSGYSKGQTFRLSAHQDKHELWWACVENLGPFETEAEAKAAAIKAAGDAE